MNAEKSIVFFDGHCNLCNGVVDFLIQRDSQRQLFYASLQGKTAAQLLTIEDRTKLESLIFISGGKTFRKSEAALEIAKKLPLPWKILSYFSWIPRWLRNSLYTVIAKNRYRFWGRQETCRIPSAEESSYLLS